MPNLPPDLMSVCVAGSFDPSFSGSVKVVQATPSPPPLSPSVNHCMQNPKGELRGQFLAVKQARAVVIVPGSDKRFSVPIEVPGLGKVTDINFHSWCGGRGVPSSIKKCR